MHKVRLGRPWQQAVEELDGERDWFVEPLTRFHEKPLQLPVREPAEDSMRQLEDPLLDAEWLPFELRKRGVVEVVLPLDVEWCRDLEGPQTREPPVLCLPMQWLLEPQLGQELVCSAVDSWPCGPFAAPQLWLPVTLASEQLHLFAVSLAQEAQPLSKWLPLEQLRSLTLLQRSRTEEMPLREVW